MASITSRAFNHDVGAAKRAAQVEPVVITDRGVPAYVLMTYDEYRRTMGNRWRSLADVLRGDFDVELDGEFVIPERTLPDESRIPDFSDDEYL